MGPVFVDSSVFIGFLARDVETRYEKAKELFQSAEKGSVKLETTEAVVAEVARQLEAEYSMERQALGRVLEAIVGTRNLKVANRAVLAKAIKVYMRGGMGFQEACNIAFMKARGRSRVATFRPGDYEGEGLEAAL